MHLQRIYPDPDQIALALRTAAAAVGGMVAAAVAMGLGPALVYLVAS